MHVDDALGGPDPVVFFETFSLDVPALDDIGVPLDAAEVDSPDVTGVGGAGHAGVLFEALPGEGDFYGPAFVGVGGVIEGALDFDRGFGVGFPRVISRAAISVGLGEIEVPGGVEGVDLELEVAGGIAVGIDEDLEIVVVENDGIVLGQGGPDVGFFELGGDIEVVVVPEHFGAGLEARHGFGVAFDVDKEVRPGS